METAHYLVESDPEALARIVKGIPEFKQEKIELGDIFARFAGLKAQVKGYLQNMVWHRWDRVAPLYKKGFGIKRFPKADVLEAAMEKRHNIVHRSGHDLDGVAVEVTAAEVHALCDAILVFAKSMDDQLDDARRARAAQAGPAGSDAPVF